MSKLFLSDLIRGIDIGERKVKPGKEQEKWWRGEAKWGKTGKREEN